MNYFAHALNHIDRPYFLAGTSIPDWLSAVDRKVRLRPRLLEPWLHSDDPVQSEVATGTLRHLADDDWFHSTRGFAEVTGTLTHMFRSQLGAGDQYHCGFLGHIAMELLLDGVLMQMHPARFEEYWRILATIQPTLVEAAVNRMVKVPTTRLAWFIDLFRREQFLRAYENDQSLVTRLNQVLVRVKLSPVPTHVVSVVADGRLLIRSRLLDLLPSDRFSLP